MANNQPDNKPGAGQVLLEEVNRTPENGSRLRRTGQLVLVPLLAILTGLIVGGIFIALTTEEVWAAFGESLIDGLTAGVSIVLESYTALITGAIGDPVRILEAFSSGDAVAIRRAINPIFESLTAATPLIFAGLSVALAFRTGLFNIGAEGQLFIGAAFAAFVGFTFTGLPAIIHVPLTIAAGIIGGGLWGFIPGWLKAKTGGHEVINTIMLNYIAFRLTEWLLRGPMQDPETFNPISPPIEPSAYLPSFFESPIRFHLGFFIALAFAWLVGWFLFKTKWGFSFRAVGANPHAARYAGMNIVNSTIMAMTMSGALAGLAGANQVMGLNHNLALAFSAGTGFDAIAIALLGKNHPIGVVLAAILFGMLETGATRMQVVTQTPVDVIFIVQALILAFIAAPAIVRTIYRLREPETGDQEMFVTTWSS